MLGGWLLWLSSLARPRVVAVRPESVSAVGLLPVFYLRKERR